MMHGRYEKEAYQFLSVFRFLAYALAVLFSQVPSFGLTTITNDLLIIVLSLLGVYSLLRVFSPMRWRERGKMTYVILAGDFALSMLLVLFTGGLNSIFLLYSLVPVMSAALFFEESVALSIAAGATLLLSMSHIALSQVTSRFGGLLQGYNLTLLIIYALFTFVCATVPYRINMNIRRRVQQEAIIEERRRIAREIHDGVAQTLSYLNMKTKILSDSIAGQKTVQALGELDDIRKVVQESYNDIRESIGQLSTEIKNVKLVSALTGYCREFDISNGIKVHLEIQKSFPELAPTAELQLFRVAQELLTNVRKHARATTVGIRLGSNPQAIEMVIRDNGKGFALDSPGESSPGYHGLNIIRERAEGLGGTIDIASVPGQGTEAKVILPLDKVRL